nr:MAG TPA: hypothetical protein [Caudoviricetes sp.]
MEIYKIRVYNFIGFCCSTCPTCFNSLIITGEQRNSIFFAL